MVEIKGTQRSTKVVAAGSDSNDLKAPPVDHAAELAQMRSGKILQERHVGLRHPSNVSQASFEGSALQFRTSPTDTMSAIVVADKPVPGRGFVFEFDPSQKTLSFDRSAENQTLGNAKKIEGSTIVNVGNKRFLVFTTAFDRVKEESSEWDCYNQIVIQPEGIDQKSYIFESVVRKSKDGDMQESSLATRYELLELLNKGTSDKVGYFKIEGLASAPSAGSTSLILGVREQGKDFKSGKFVFKLITVPLSTSGDGKLIQNGSSKVLGDFDVNKIDPETGVRKSGLPHDVGISSVEYDANNKRFVVATTWEKATQDNNAQYGEFGTYFWTLGYDQSAGRVTESPQLLYDSSGQPLHVYHKVEGMDFIPGSNGTKLMLIADDDRAMQDPRHVLNEVRESPEKAWTAVLEIK